MREEVLRLIRSAGGPISAHSLARHLAERETSIHASAVFRAVNELVSAELVDRIEALACYVPRRRPMIGTVCSGCGSFGEVAAPALMDELDAAARRAGWTPRRLVAEIVGRCSRCSGSIAPPDA